MPWAWVPLQFPSHHKAWRETQLMPPWGWVGGVFPCETQKEKGRHPAKWSRDMVGKARRGLSSEGTARARNLE